MKKLITDLNRLPQADLLNLCRNIIMIAERCAIAALLNDPLYLKFKTAFERLFASLNKKRKSGLGAVVRNCDRKRDKAYTRLKNFLIAHAGMDSDQGRAADELLHTISAPGRILRTPYARKTEQLSKVIDELTSDHGRQLAETLGTQFHIDALKEAQELFIATVAEQRDADSALNQADTPGEIKPEVVELLLDLLNLIYIKRNHDDAWRDLYFDVKAAVEFARITLRSKRRKKQSAATATVNS